MVGRGLLEATTTGVALFPYVAYHASFAFVPSLSFFEQYLSGFLATQSQSLELFPLYLHVRLSCVGVVGGRWRPHQSRPPHSLR